MTVRASLRTPLTTRRFLATALGSAALSASVVAAIILATSGTTVGAAPVTELVQTPAPVVVNEATNTTGAVPDPTVTAAPSTTAAPAVDLGDDTRAVVQSAPATVSPSWTRASSADCHCSAEFPFAPKTTQTNGTNLLIAERSGSPLSAAIFSAPATTDSPTIDDLWSLLSSVAGGKGEITESSSSTDANGAPTMTATLGSDTARSRVKVFVVNGQSYVLLFGNSAGAVNEADFTRFVNSFALS